MDCWECGRKIAKKDDANLLLFLGFRITPFCDKCYAHHEKNSLERHIFFVPRYPMNGAIFVLALWAATLVFFWLSFSFWIDGLQSVSVLFVAIIVFEWVLYFKAQDLLANLS